MTKTSEEILTEPARPLCIELENARTEIYGLLNDISSRRNIPYYLLESIVLDAARDVSELAKKERQAAAQSYQKKMAEYNARKEVNSDAH